LTRSPRRYVDLETFAIFAVNEVRTMTEPEIDPADLDPDEVVTPQPADIEETVVDEIDDFERPAPLEANEADVVEQRWQVDESDEYDADR
jgi:hypothetical protein